jgi:hypothetical protein
MGFKENLLKKIEINRLAHQVRTSWKPADPPGRIDKAAMKALLDMTPLIFRRERDLDLYCEADTAEKQRILVFDNELKLYDTTIEDVAMRKSPTVKEMVNIRNAIKILSDKDVVVSMKTDTLAWVQNQLIDGLDLSYEDADIDALARNGAESLRNAYTEGIVEVMTLFCELLGYAKAPKAFQLPHTHIWGRVDRTGAAAERMAPAIVYSLVRNTLNLLNGPINANDPDDLRKLQQVAAGDDTADVEGEAVFDALRDKVLKERPDTFTLSLTL